MKKSWPTFFSGLFIASALLVSNARAVSIPVLTWATHTVAGKSYPEPVRSDWINVKDYGATGNGTTDDTAAIQAALNVISVVYAAKATLYFPPGTYKITSSLMWNNSPTWAGSWGMNIVGCGSNTTIQWAGTSSGQTMFYFNGGSYSSSIGIAWNGGSGVNEAAYGFTFATFTNQTEQETTDRIENNAFVNFTVAGVTSYGGGSASEQPACSDQVWNCLFQNCAIGIVVGSAASNNYDWTIEADEFLNCGIGVNTPYGKGAVFDDQFQGSTQYDILTNPNMPIRVRRCTSIGSAVFFATAGGIQRATVGQVISDCHIDSWKSTAGAIQLNSPGPDQVFDCVFTTPPAGGNPPIVMNCVAAYPGLLTVSGNYCSTIPQTVNTPSNFTVDTIPCGTWGSNLTSPKISFLQTTWPADSANVLDVTQAPYTADRTGATDSTATIQAAINAAKTANNGSLVYIPTGNYKISSTLTVTGGNYTIQGSGYPSQLVWYGAAGGTIMAVTTPQNVTVQQLQFKTQNGDSAGVGLKETSTGASNLVLDNNFFNVWTTGNAEASQRNMDGLGLVLQDLPADSMTYLEESCGALLINDCGPATILGNFFQEGRVTVNGATHAKTGFTGLDYFTMSGNPAGYDVIVDDNQDLAIENLYEEQGGGSHLHVNRGAGTWTGRVSIQGEKEQNQAVSGAAFIQADNYAGRVFYGPTWAINTGFSVGINQTGTNALDLILPGNYWQTLAPTYSITSACNLIKLQNYVYDGSSTYTIQPDIKPTGWGASAAQGLDYLRQLAALDLQYRFGIGNILFNSSAELDAVNPNPLTTLGYAPADWDLTDTFSNATGVRNVTTVSGASPFGPGAQSMYAVDTTASTSGSRLQYQQNVAALAASQGAVFSFDFNLDSTATNDDFWLRAFAGTTACCYVHLTGNGSSNHISAYISGHDTSLAAVTANTWYRVQVAIQPPANGISNATLYLTPWTVSGPGTTQTFTIDGVPAVTSTGLDEVYMNQSSAGESLKVHLDNITLVSGDPLL